MVNQMKTMAGKWAQEHRRKAAALRKEAGAGVDGIFDEAGEDWTTGVITVAEGANTIIVTITDDNSLTGQDQIEVTRSAVGTVPARHGVGVGAGHVLGVGAGHAMGN